MEKVESSSLFIRSWKAPENGAFVLSGSACSAEADSELVPLLPTADRRSPVEGVSNRAAPGERMIAQGTRLVVMLARRHPLARAALMAAVGVFFAWRGITKTISFWGERGWGWVAMAAAVALFGFAVI